MSDISDQGADVAVPALDAWLSFHDLRKAGVVFSWKTLREWQLDPRIGFPLGRLFGANSRRWSQKEINAWLASRPVVRDGFPTWEGEIAASRRSHEKCRASLTDDTTDTEN